MLTIKNHFLDTNIILSIAFENSNFKICADYCKLNYNRFVSQTVKDEAHAVVERFRKISIDIVKHIKQYISTKKISLVNLEYHLNAIKKAYLDKFKNDEYVFNIKKEKFTDIVQDVFVEFSDEIKSAIINNDLDLIDLTSKLRNNFKKYYSGVNRCIKNFVLFDAPIDEQLKSSLINIKIHESDAIILNDCYYKSEELNKKFVFITQDVNLIDKSKKVQKLLNEKVYILNPSFFLNS